MRTEIIRQIYSQLTLSIAKGSLNIIFQDSFNTILSQQLTHDRFYICKARTCLYDV